MSFPWRWARRAAGFAAVCYVGLRIRIPGIRPDWLGSEIWNANDSPLLKLFDAITGDGLSRGSILALSVTPFLTARCYMWLGKKMFPRLAAMDEKQDGRERLQRWTRVLNVSIALAQSYGYARFLQGIPNVVVTPGPAFIAGTMALLTTGAVTMMYLSERITETAGEAAAIDNTVAESESTVSRAIAGSHELPALNAPQPVDEILQRRVVLSPDKIRVSK